MHSTRGLAIPASFFLLLSSTGPAWPQVKENLDLPFDALGEEEEDEDAPEIVNFYSTNLEGDGFFYVVDRSGSMVDSGELQRAKQELNKNISEFSNRVEFGIIFFATETVKFPSSGLPAQATEAMKQAAKSFVNSQDRARGSCCMTGMLEGLRLANRGKARRKVLVYLGDGGGTCGGTNEAQYLEKALSTITGQNHQRIRINTIGVVDVSSIGDNFLRRLAAANGGSYTRIH
jgi:Mg-chelatase subunit ChlD